MQRILILSFSAISRDPRVMRQVHLLASRYEVTVAGFGAKPDAHVEFVCVVHPRTKVSTKLWWGLKLFLGLFESYYWNRIDVQSALTMLRGRKFDLTISNDISALPLALHLAEEQPVLIDAHEYSPLEFEDRWLWRLLFGRHYHDLCKRHLPQAAGMTTVCQGIADEYARQFCVQPELVLNAPPHQQLRPSRTECGRMRMIHHGAAIRSRHLETMIEVMQHLDSRFTLDFMLVPNDPAYVDELRARAARDSRIRFLPPVPMPNICTALNDYDIGLFLLPPVNFNYRHALPNKFFEFIQARLAVAIGPSPEMARFVRTYGFGVIAESFQPAALAAVLSKISEADLVRYKLAADVAAVTVNFETSGRTLLALIERLLNKQAAQKVLTESY